MKLIIPFLLILWLPLAHASDLGKQLEQQGFHETVRKERGDLKSAQTGVPFYSVSIENGRLVLSKHRSQPNGAVDLFKSAKYRYMASDGGEWGGGLEAVDAQGKKFQLLKKNTLGLFQAGDKLYALTGINHLTLNSGALYRIQEETESPTVSLVTLLTGAPMDVVVDDRALYILTDNDLLYFRPDDTYPDLHVIVHNGVWDGLATGMVKLDNQLAIGMHGGVVIVDLNRWEGRNATYRYYAKE